MRTPVVKGADTRNLQLKSQNAEKRMDDTYEWTDRFLCGNRTTAAAGSEPPVPDRAGPNLFSAPPKNLLDKAETVWIASVLSK